jgi:hypothetical protein
MKKLIIFAVIVVGIFAFIAVFILYNSKPDKLSDKAREEALGQILGRKPNLNPQVKAGESTFTGKYISLSYPARAKIYEYISDSVKKDKAFLETFSFDIDAPRMIFNYTAYKNAADLTGLDEFPAVSFRQNKSNGYSEKKVMADGVGGLSFSKQGSGEYKSESSAFFFKDDALYSFSVTANSPQDAQKLLGEILKTVVFIQ